MFSHHVKNVPWLYIFIYVRPSAASPFLTHAAAAGALDAVLSLGRVRRLLQVPPGASLQRADLADLRPVAQVDAKFIVARLRQEIRRVDDTVGNPHRAQISQFELFELLL